MQFKRFQFTQLKINTSKRLKVASNIISMNIVKKTFSATTIHEDRNTFIYETGCDSLRKTLRHTLCTKTLQIIWMASLNKLSYNRFASFLFCSFCYLYHLAVTPSRVILTLTSRLRFATQMHWSITVNSQFLQTNLEFNGCVFWQAEISYQSLLLCVISPVHAVPFEAPHSSKHTLATDVSYQVFKFSLNNERRYFN